MKEVILNIFQARAYPDLAAVVRAVSPRVVARWLEEVKNRLATADELTLAELRNSVPRTLERLAKALESIRPAATRDMMVESEEHGVDRVQRGYHLTELLVEFDLLRPILIDEVANALRRDLDLTEFTALIVGVDLIARRSVVAFADLQTRRLVEASKLQSRFFAFLSHDIRGGLSAILMNIDLLKLDLPADPKFASALEDLESMRRSIMDTVGVMSRYLDTERLRSGTVQPKTVPLNLPQLIGDIVGQFRHAATNKQIILSSDVPPSCDLESDRELVTMILQNLVGNAIKYSTGGRVTISARITDSNGCKLSVSDEGPGIAPEKVATLFEAFRRGDTHGQGGLGLGLSIVDHAARLLSAEVQVEANPEGGTTFHVLFQPGTSESAPPQSIT